MTHVCRECRYFDPLSDLPKDVPPLGKCALSREKFGADVTKPEYAPACSGFANKLTGQRPGEKYWGVRRGR